MAETGKNPLSRVERQKTNYPLIATVVVLFVLLAAGTGLSINDQSWTAAMLFVAAALVLVLAGLIEITHNRRLAATDDRKFIRWDAAMPEVQRQNVNVEVRELARLLNVGSDQFPDLLSAYLVAEDLALR